MHDYTEITQDICHYKMDFVCNRFCSSSGHFAKQILFDNALFMHRAGLSASTASPMFARICGQGAFRSDSISPIGALAAPHPKFAS
ncbi:MAG: hypothetical protein LBO79_10730 [Zoogloeaceae bacterium]|nr:hypothetical protein [Zoogloeaceae bacterium]